ncbi:magnesium/cobalt transporter CorA [Methanospirillum sp.]|uniref:magnesium/cobalt transporter CorA n=1 Tax=Methanospirillum sp. TaxID=45200 RepID=UPI002C8A0EF2|nr:magnesium/cobalt transporter CorA [Methanospirillum sp.]HPP77107.1 magnesium/cobalt transporter CorA [Methanospirillum sp.]
MQGVTYEEHISIKTGLPPGIPIYIGRHEPEQTQISALVYTPENTQVYPEISPADIIPIRSKPGICWIHISGLRDSEKINQIFSDAELHSLITEDVFNTKGRAKFEDFGDTLFVTLDIILTSGKEWHSRKINIITKKGFLISISETPHPFENIKTRILHPNGKFRTHGIDYLMYSLIDSVVDTYFYGLERIEDIAERLEEEVVHDPSPEIIQEIQSFRHMLINFKRQVWSLRDVIMHLERSDSDILTDSIRVFLRDVHDHVIKISEDLDIHREMAEGIMEIYLSSVSNRTNEIVRVLTVIAVIFIPLTFITGVYGMNFAYLPGIDHPAGPLIIFGIMILVMTCMVGIFKWKKWI